MSEKEKKQPPYTVKKTVYHNSIEYAIYNKVIQGQTKKEKEDIYNCECDNIKDTKDSKHSEYTSLNRTKNNIVNIARANEWLYFLTYTFNPHLIDVFDLEECKKKLQKHLNNLRTRKCPDMYYLSVPEQHKSGAWHFHLLIGGNVESINNSMEIVPSRINDIYNVNSWKWGFSTATKVKDTKRVSSYICKYITKSLTLYNGKNRYFASQNCKKGIVEYMNIDDTDDIMISLLEQSTYFKTVKAQNIGLEITYINIEME